MTEGGCGGTREADRGDHRPDHRAGDARTSPTAGDEADQGDNAQEWGNPIPSSGVRHATTRARFAPRQKRPGRAGRHGRTEEEGGTSDGDAPEHAFDHRALISQVSVSSGAWEGRADRMTSAAMLSAARISAGD